MTTIAPGFASSLAFQLSQIGARSAHLFAERLASLGVSPKAFGVLGNLQATGERTQQELADALGIHRNNMVGLIDELETSGWVARRRSDTDRRAFHIELTSAGAGIVEAVNAVVPRLDDELGHDLDDAERRVLAELLRRVAGALGLTPGVHPHLAARTAGARADTAVDPAGGRSQSMAPAARSASRSSAP